MCPSPARAWPLLETGESQGKKMETHKKVAQSQAPNRRLCPFAKKGWDQLPVWAEEKEIWEAGAPSWALECQGAA